MKALTPKLRAANGAERHSLPKAARRAAPECAGNGEAERSTLQNAVTATDRQIDEAVYALYALTPEEIGLVEGSA